MVRGRAGRRNGAVEWLGLGPLPAPTGVGWLRTVRHSEEHTVTSSPAILHTTYQAPEQDVYCTDQLADCSALRAESKPKLAIFSTGASSDEDDTPLAKSSQPQNGHSNRTAKTSSPSTKPASKSKPASNPAADSSDDDVPLAQTATKAKAAPAKRRASKAKSGSDESELSAQESSEDEKPKKKAPAKKPRTSAASTKAKPASKAKEAAPPKKKVKKEDTPDVKPAVKKAPAKGKTVKAEEGEGKGEDEEEEYKWWEQTNDGSTKWTTLEHAGVMFPPEYEKHGVKMKYEGKSITLSPEAEEVASFYAAILETDYPKNPTFASNFFKSFLGVLESHPGPDGAKIKSYDKCDFRPIYEYLEVEKAKKKDISQAQKKLNKADKDKVEEPYKFCLLDGRKEKVGNFRVEPPGLFRGRGEHPKTGLLKTRLQPEDITINIGKEAKVPEPPAGHNWKKVVHDNTVTWLATWKENINGNVKYVFLAAGSSLKGQSDLAKFEKARELKKHVDKIRKDYTNDLKDKETFVRQRATAVYFIDRFALRNGNEKGEDEADTVGCCSLRGEHITLAPPNSVTFDFLGKDSIRYVNEVKVDDQVFKNLKIFKKTLTKPEDKLFDRLETSHVNKWLTSYMPGLTAKVFRTYNASWTFVQQLKDTPPDASVADKILAYNRANRMVAVLCNHQRAVSKGHSAAMEKMADKVRALKYQKMKLRKALLHSTGGKKAFAKYKEPESDLEDDWVKEHEKQLVVLEREKITKKFDKENVQRAEGEEKQAPLPKSVLKERLEAADALAEKIKEERKAKYTETKLSDDKLVANIDKLDERIKLQKMAVLDKDEGKEISLGTSKINYLGKSLCLCAWSSRHLTDLIACHCRPPHHVPVVRQARRPAGQDVLQDPHREVQVGRRGNRGRLRLVNKSTCFAPLQPCHLHLRLLAIHRFIASLSPTSIVVFPACTVSVPLFRCIRCPARVRCTRRWLFLSISMPTPHFSCKHCAFSNWVLCGSVRGLKGAKGALLTPGGENCLCW